MKAEAFAQALDALIALNDAMASNIPAMRDAVLADGLRNGLAQKFEYTTELCWKAVKEYVKKVEGKEAASPKQAVKAFYLMGHVSEEEYLSLISAIDDRNLLSHVYEETVFADVLSRLGGYLPVFRRVLAALTS